MLMRRSVPVPHVCSRTFFYCFGFGAETSSWPFFKGMHFHYAHNFQLAHIISLHGYSVWQRSRESKHELPSVMKV